MSGNTNLYWVWICDKRNTLLQLHVVADPHEADSLFTSLCNGYGFEPAAGDFIRGYARTMDGSFVCFRPAPPVTCTPLRVSGYDWTDNGQDKDIAAGAGI